MCHALVIPSGRRVPLSKGALVHVANRVGSNPTQGSNYDLVLPVKLQRQNTAQFQKLLIALRGRKNKGVQDGNPSDLLRSGQARAGLL
jgi:hypothetical protein